MITALKLMINISFWIIKTILKHITKIISFAAGSAWVIYATRLTLREKFPEYTEKETA